MSCCIGGARVSDMSAGRGDKEWCSRRHADAEVVQV